MLNNDIVFQTLSWNNYDVLIEENDEEVQKFLIKVFGVDENGKTISVNIENFTPFFMIKCEQKITQKLLDKFREFISSKLENISRYRDKEYLSRSFIDIKLLKKKDFWGFHNDETFSFLRVTFNCLESFKYISNIFSKNVNIDGNIRKYKLYESNIEPLLRFMHIRNIQSCGWISISDYSINNDLYKTTSDLDISCDWRNVNYVEKDKLAPIKICSFDLECTSSHGDFPVARKDYKKVAYELMQLFNENKIINNDDILQELLSIFYKDKEGKLSKVYLKSPELLQDEIFSKIKHNLIQNLDDILNILKGRLEYKKFTYKKINERTKKEEEKSFYKYTPVMKSSKDAIIKSLTRKFGLYEINEETSEERWVGIFPKLLGDPIIQIGTTVHKYGETECSYKHILTLGSCDNIDNVDVESCNTEDDLLLKWVNLIHRINPDVITGYNIFGFDMSYIYDRAKELNILNEFMMLGRIIGKKSIYSVKKLSSSALGDNELKMIEMDGRVSIDLMKVIQRDHKLDSYKLDNVANYFMKMNKNDVSPNDIFRLQKGTSSDRKIIAQYCVVDCELCNKLIMKLEILANNIGMANVCSVPLSYIFLRGQGIKIFSLVAKQCREDGFVIPVRKKVNSVEFIQQNKNNEDEDDDLDDEDGYEGAIVLPPKEGIYIKYPISVFDYASLYPSSMISENLSHDMFVNNSKYDNLPNVNYLTLSYDVYEGEGDKKVKTGIKECKFVQPKNNEKGVIPRILMKLLKARKDTRKKIEYKTIITKNKNEYIGFMSEDEKNYILKKIDNTEISIDKLEVEEIKDTYNDFEKAVLDGLQLAYKVTANSLYGQIGAKTSPIYLKEIAACTTATGRNMILKAKDFVEKQYNGKVIYGDSVTGDTPILVRDINGNIDIISIDSLSNTWFSYNEFKKYDTTLDNKEQAQAYYEVWSDNKWSSIRRVIRHKTNKKIYRVNTFQGCVDVTEDHSLIDINDNQIKPEKCECYKTEIKHNFPEHIENSSRNIHPYICNEAYLEILENTNSKNKLDKKEAFLYGLYFGNGEIINYNKLIIKLYHNTEEIIKKYINTENIKWILNDNKLITYNIKLINDYKNLFYEKNRKKIPKIILNSDKIIREEFFAGYLYTFSFNENINVTGKLAAQGIYYLLKSLDIKNITVELSDFIEDKYIFNHLSDNINKNQVKFYKQINNNDEYVYDIETETGKFHGGVGSIILKNTDSIFTIFETKDENGNDLTGKNALSKSREIGMKCTKEFKQYLKAPHDLEWEKMFWPFIIFSKKRYVGNLYEHDDNKFKQKSMGIALKRRDYANIVKHIYGGCLDIILNKQDIKLSIKFLNNELNKLINGQVDIKELIISKSLKSDYKDPERIAHKVLAERMGERDPGNKPLVNDRIPFVYIQTSTKKNEKILQGNRIEHPDYIKEKNLKPDYEFYITNQIMKPILQLYSLTMEEIDGYKKTSDYWEKEEEKLFKIKEGDIKKIKERLITLKENYVKELLFDSILTKLSNKKNGNREITEFFKII